MQADIWSFRVDIARLIDKLRLQLGIVENMPGPVEKGLLTSYEDGCANID